MLHRHFRLITLGRLALLTPGGLEEPSLSTRRRKLAVLTVIALSPQPVSRDTLVEMFWGEEDEDRARHSLADTLSHLRRVLGKDAIAARREELSLNPQAPLSIDAVDVSQAARLSDWTQVLACYAGEFFQGVHAGGSAALEQWVGRERDRLRQCFLAAAARHTRRYLSAREWENAEVVAARWVAHDPLSEEAALALLKATAGEGQDESERRALAEAERHATRLRREFDLPLAPAVADAVSQLGAGIRARERARDAELRAGSARRFRRWLAAAAVLGAIALGVRAGRSAGETGKPVLAVIGVRNGGSDGKRAWIAEGLPQMIAAALSRSSAVDVVSPERLNEVRVRAETGPAARLDEQLELGRRAGATWAVTGSFVTADSLLVLSLEVHETDSRKMVRIFTVASPDPLRLADQAAARLLDAANARGPGPRLAETETASLDAYEHFVRSLQAGEAGRFLESTRELDAALALDSGFVSALRARLVVAVQASDTATAGSLERAFDRNASRASEWDRLEMAEQQALHTGARERPEELAREMVHRFPRDPRAYGRLFEVYINHGLWQAADTVMQQELALDSLAVTAGRGPCVPCEAFGGLSTVRVLSGQFAAAEVAARRWVDLQPELPAAWTNLAAILSFEQRFPEALEAAEHATLMGPGEVIYEERVAAIHLLARDYAWVDSVSTAWMASPDRTRRLSGTDLAFTLRRELGQYLASARLVERLRPGEAGGLTLVAANSLARTGRLAEADRLYETTAHNPRDRKEPVQGDAARGFAWQHALLASVLREAGDTTRLAALADSIQRIGNRSYYGRDWNLFEYVRGVLALRAGHPADAATHLERARWGRAGWTEIDVVLAEAYEKTGRIDAAVKVLRDAYGGPLDAMGRYVPRTELDFALVTAYTLAGKPDSARWYRDRVAAAWTHADAEPRRRLAALGLASARRTPED